MATNEFLPFATAGGAGVISQAAYVSLAARLAGFVDGIADPDELNKVWRQAASMSSMLGQLIVDRAGRDALDDGNIAVLQAAMETLLRKQSVNYIGVGGTANALTATFAPAVASYTEIVGAPLRLLINTPNTGAATLNVNGLGAVNIVRNDTGTALLAGDLSGIVQVVHDGTAFRLLSYQNKLPLAANRTLYVSSAGNDSNNGLSAGTPFATLQRAWSEVLRYDLNGFVVTIQIGDGTYTAGLVATSSPLGATQGTGSVVIQGNPGTPANVLVAVTGANCFTAQGGASFTVKDLKLQTAGANTNGLVANPAGLIAFSNVDFGSCVNAHINAAGGFVQATGNYRISGSAAFHKVASAFGKVSNSGVTVTLTGTPGFSGAYAYSQQGRVEAVGTLYSGGATGSRYNSTENGVITTNGAGASALPGNAAGSASAGGQYV